MTPTLTVEIQWPRTTLTQCKSNTSRKLLIPHFHKCTCTFLAYEQVFRTPHHTRQSSDGSTLTVHEMDEDYLVSEQRYLTFTSYIPTCTCSLRHNYYTPCRLLEQWVLITSLRLYTDLLWKAFSLMWNK